MRGNAAPTNPWVERCPNDQIATAAQGHAGGRIDQFGIECAPVTLAWDGAGYQVFVRSPTPIPAQKRPRRHGVSRSCPAAGIVIGNDTSANAWIQGMDLLCAGATPAP